MVKTYSIRRGRKLYFKLYPGCRKVVSTTDFMTNRISVMLQKMEPSENFKKWRLNIGPYIQGSVPKATDSNMLLFAGVACRATWYYKLVLSGYDVSTD
jgi:hypothetical protein